MSHYTDTNPDLGSETSMDKVQEVASRTQQIVSETASAAQQKVGETAAVAKEQVTRKAAEMGEQAKSTVDSRMNEVAHELGSVAEAVRQTTHEVAGDDNTVVARYGERLAGQIEGISSYLNNNGVEQVLDDLQGFARRQPAMFLGGAFMLGIVVGRFLRSSADRGYGYDQEYTGGSYGGQTNYGDYQGQGSSQTGRHTSMTSQNWD